MKQNNYNVVGVMSGTSLDGIDLAQVHFWEDQGWHYKIITAETVPYPQQWRQKLAGAITYNDLRLQDFDQEYTSHLAEVIYSFIIRNNIRNLDAVCSHGHTIRHEPERGFTLQVGNQPKLAKMLEQRVVCDFRVQDVRLGGQGAPLVPIGDELLFSEYDYCLNLGGFANISCRSEGQRTAWDICAVNTVLNHLAGKLGLQYDDNGELAASGKLNEEVLQQLESLPFYQQEAPKSLGMEWVNRHALPLLNMGDIYDMLKTYVIHAAGQIARELKGKGARALVTGGGAFNSFLIEEIQKRTSVSLVIPSPDLINYKEAVIFGFLGVLRLRDEINVLGSVTGAERDHSSGVIFESR